MTPGTVDLKFVLLELLQGILSFLHIYKGNKVPFGVLKDVSGVIRPVSCCWSQNVHGTQSKNQLGLSRPFPPLVGLAVYCTTLHGILIVASSDHAIVQPQTAPMFLSLHVNAISFHVKWIFWQAGHFVHGRSSLYENVVLK